MAAQVAALTDELQALKSEIIGVKAGHASMHQMMVESGTTNAQQFGAQADRIVALEKRIETTIGKGSIDGKPKPLIEAKQIEVSAFAGSMSDDRSKFYLWTEKTRDRIALFDANLLRAMRQVEKLTSPITAEDVAKYGVSEYDNTQLQGFLKDRTTGTANNLIRSNKACIGHKIASQ